MKRPLAVFGLTFLSALAVVSCFGINYTKYHTIAIIITAALFLLSFIVTRRGKGKALPVFFAAVTVSLILFSVKAAYVGRLTDGLAADTKQPYWRSFPICHTKARVYGIMRWKPSV